MTYILVKKPSKDLIACVEKRQGLGPTYAKRNLKDPRGDRIYFYHTKRGPEVAMLGFIFI